MLIRNGTERKQEHRSPPAEEEALRSDHHRGALRVQRMTNPIARSAYVLPGPPLRNPVKLVLNPLDTPDHILLPRRDLPELIPHPSERGQA